MKITNSILVLAMGGLMVTGSAIRSNRNLRHRTGDRGHPRVYQVNKREANQQKRIANGIDNAR